MKLDRYQENSCFQGVELQNGELTGIEFVDCTFENCTIENTALIRCCFTDCTFVDCRLSDVTATYSSMKNGEFIRCALLSIHWQEWTMGGSGIRPIRRLEDCQLKYNIFQENNFSKFDFSDNIITGSMFAGCNLSKSQFVHSQLERTEFFKCNLSKADFRQAAGYVVDLPTCQLAGAKFSYPEVVNLLACLNIEIE